MGNSKEALLNLAKNTPSGHMRSFAYSSRHVTSLKSVNVYNIMVVGRLLCHYVLPFTVFYFCVQQTTSETPKVSGLNSAWELHSQKASIGFVPYIGIWDRNCEKPEYASSAFTRENSLIISEGGFYGLKFLATNFRYFLRGGCLVCWYTRNVVFLLHEIVHGFQLYCY